MVICRSYNLFRGWSLHKHRFYGDEAERRKWQNPETILGEAGLRKGLIFIDIGCGSGFFSIPAAKVVGPQGKVYALDIDQQAISLLQKRAAAENLKNIETEAGNAEDCLFCEGCADIVFFGIVLHDFNDPAKVLLTAKKMLKATGRVVDLDWKREPMDIGPPLQIRFDEKQAMRLIEKAGFKIDSVRDVGSFQYIIVATR
jgi:ubiquinone/menaquinone biosynthesis C-methylase UbiE